MRESKDASDNRIYLITSKIMYLFMVNIWFLISISPIIIYFFGAGENLSVYILSFLGILIGPALSTMFSVMGRFMRDENTSALKDYIYFYKMNILQGLFIATVINAIVMISYLDIGYFLAKDIDILVYFFIFILIMALSLSVYVYPIIGRINAKSIDVFKIAIKLIFKKFYVTLTIISVLIIGGAIVNFIGISLIALLFGASAVCYVILYLEKNILVEAEKFLREKYDT